MGWRGVKLESNASYRNRPSVTKTSRMSERPSDDARDTWRSDKETRKQNAKEGLSMCRETLERCKSKDPWRG